MVDKNKAIVEYLLKCDPLKSNPLFFNYINAKDNSKQIITRANDKYLDRPFIDGSVMKRYTFIIIDFKSITNNPIVKDPKYMNENVQDLEEVQQIINWIDDQNMNNEFPNFGDDCVVESIKALSDSPKFKGVDGEVSPPLVQYTITIQIDYLDNSHKLWK